MLDEKDKIIKKVVCNYELLRDWIEMRHVKRKIEDYFIARGYSTIIVYGGGEIGQLFIEEILESGIGVKYVIDSNAENIFLGVPVVKKYIDFENIDVIVVTAVFAFEEIYKNLARVTEVPIVSLKEVISDI